MVVVVVVDCNCGCLNVSCVFIYLYGACGKDAQRTELSLFVSFHVRRSLLLYCTVYTK